MSRIFGLQGNFNGNLLISMLESMRKNKKSSEIFLSSGKNTIFNNKFCIANFNKEFYNIGLGFSPVSIGDKDNKKFIDKNQLIKYKNLILTFDGKIYNSDNLQSEIDSSNSINSDRELIIKLIYNFYLSKKNLLESVQKTIDVINGDYAFAIYDGKSLAITRDTIGIKPLYYCLNSKKGHYNDYSCFGSEKKSFWNIGIANSNIMTLKPGYILYNWKEIAPNSAPWEVNHINITNNNNINHNDNIFNINSNDTENITNEYHKNLNNENNSSKIINMDYNQIKSQLTQLIKNSVYKRVENLNEVGLVFSGGVDSTIIATILKNITKDLEFSSNLKKLNVKLYSVGTKNSKDLKYSKKIAEQLELPIKTQIITEEIVQNSLNPVLEAIEEANIMKIGVGMTLYLATKLANLDKFSIVLAGQGADELFGGYNRYLTTLKNGGSLLASNELVNDIKNSYETNLERDNKIANSNEVDLRIPFLDEELVNFSLNIPIKYKIISTEDKLRKCILRDIAIDLGIDEEIAMRPKKAAQYGSGIDKIVRKKVLKSININDKMSDIINNYYD